MEHLWDLVYGQVFLIFVRAGLTLFRKDICTICNGNTNQTFYAQRNIDYGSQLGKPNVLI